MDLQKPAEAREAFREMRNRLEGVLKPKEKFAALMMKQVEIVGQEVIFGARQDNTFGPVLMFGLGGIFTEVLGDVSLRVLPAERRDIVEMIQETRGYRALKGARGREPSDIESLVVNLLNLAQLVQDFEEIKEIDLNPVLSYAQGCTVLDARFIF
jgi:acyl-CoA synthetase (NDP forming)